MKTSVRWEVVREVLNYLNLQFYLKTSGGLPAFMFLSPSSTPIPMTNSEISCVASPKPWFP